MTTAILDMEGTTNHQGTETLGPVWVMPTRKENQGSSRCAANYMRIAGLIHPKSVVWVKTALPGIDMRGIFNNQFYSVKTK